MKIATPNIVLLVTAVLLLAATNRFSDAADTTTTTTTTPVEWTLDLSGFVIDSNPALYRDGFYIGSNDGRLYKVNVSTRTIPWNYQTGNQISTTPALLLPSSSSSSSSSSSPLIYFTSDDSKVYVVRTDTAATLWSFSTGPYFIESSPALALKDSVLVFGGTSDFTLYGVNASTGSILWQNKNLQSGRYYSKAAVSSQAYDGEATIYIGATSGVFYAVEAATGASRWSLTTGGPIYSDAVFTLLNGTVPMIYIGSDDHSMYGVRASDGAIVFKTSGGDKIKAHSIVYKNRLYFGTQGGDFYSLDATTGAVMWVYTGIGGLLDAGPTLLLAASSGASVNKDLLFVPSTNGKVAALTLDGNADWIYSTGKRSDGFASYGVVYPGPDQANRPATHLLIVSQLGVLTAINLQTANELGQGRGTDSATTESEKGTANRVVFIVVPLASVFVVVCVIVCLYVFWIAPRNRREESQRQRAQAANGGVHQQYPQQQQQYRGPHHNALGGDGGGRPRRNTPPLLGVPQMEVVEGRPVGHDGGQEMRLYSNQYDPISQQQQQPHPQQHSPHHHNYLPAQEQVVAPPLFVASGATTTTASSIATASSTSQAEHDHEAEEVTLRKWREDLAACTRSSQNVILQLDWLYVLRLTRNFSDLLEAHATGGPSAEAAAKGGGGKHHNKKGDGSRQHNGKQRSSGMGASADSVALFHGMELVEGVLLHFVVKVATRPIMTNSRNPPGHNNDDDDDGSAFFGGALPDELQLISKLRHKNIVRIYGFAIDNTTNAITTQSTTPMIRYCLVMEKLIGGTLASILLNSHRASHWSARQRVYCALGVAHGLKHMHTKAVFHRDIKSANVMLRDSVEGVLIDFDISCESLGLDESTGLPQTMGITAQRRVFGTPGYICPDYARMFCGYGIAQEVYSFGVLLLELLTGRLSIPAEIDITDPTVNETLDPRVVWAKPQALLRLAREMTKVKSKDRPSLETVIYTLQLWMVQTEEECSPGLQAMAKDKDANSAVASLQHNIMASSTGVGNVGATDTLSSSRQDSATLSATSIACVICSVDVEAEGGQGVECSDPSRHYMCRECLNNRIGVLLEGEGTVDLLTLGCSIPGCSGHWFFSDFASRLTPNNIKRWHLRSVQHAKQSGQAAAQETYTRLMQQCSDGSFNEIRCQMELVRALLRPKCPFCGLVFESFSGCTTVTCGVKDRQHRVIRGCGKQFCGACMTAKPCPANHGHEFFSPVELHECWRQWRKGAFLQYLEQAFGPNAAGRVNSDPGVRSKYELLLEVTRADLEACGIYPTRIART